MLDIKINQIIFLQSRWEFLRHLRHFHHVQKMETFSRVEHDLCRYKQNLLSDFKVLQEQYSNKEQEDYQTSWKAGIAKLEDEGC